MCLAIRSNLYCHGSKIRFLCLVYSGIIDHEPRVCRLIQLELEQFIETIDEERLLEFRIQCKQGIRA